MKKILWLVVLACLVLAVGCTTTTTKTTTEPMVADGKVIKGDDGKPLTRTTTQEDTDNSRHYKAYVDYEKNRKPLMEMVAATQTTTTNKYDEHGNVVESVTTKGVAPIQITGAAKWIINYPGKGVRPYESQFVAGLKAGAPYVSAVVPLLYPLLGIDNLSYSSGSGGTYIDGNVNISGSDQSQIAVFSDNQTPAVAIGGSGGGAEGATGGAATAGSTPTNSNTNNSQRSVGVTLGN